MSVSYSLTEYK